MEPVSRTLEPEARPNKTLSFPNGALKKHHLRPPPPLPPPQAADFLYRECLKNHAASLGGHALDGCGEFMPSPAANPADPTSLKCAACGCHRNFHRRLPEPHHHHHHHDGDDQEGEDEMDGGDEDDQMEDNDGEDRHRHRSSSSPPPYFSSAPHMLLALSAGLSGGPAPGPNPARPITPAAAPGSTSAAAAAVMLPRKRFRTKFSPEQKERMHELSERLGWRMQKRDEGLVEEWCREIGVGKGVFKVWMHNNKHNFVPGSSRRGEIGSSSGGGGGGGGGSGSGGNGSGSGGVEEGTVSGAGGGNSLVVNGSSSSS